jgi:hypothetical protein
MTNLINCADIIDWKYVIDTLQGLPSSAYIKPEEWANKKDYNEIHSLWMNANMNIAGVKVFNYEPEQIDSSVIPAMEKFLGLTHVESWISKIDPGCMAPYHWDFDNPNLVTLPHDPIRYSVHISEFSFGHVFILEDTIRYNHKVGDMIKFPTFRAWHAGANLGLVPKYMYHFVGY